MVGLSFYIRKSSGIKSCTLAVQPIRTTQHRNTYTQFTEFFLYVRLYLLNPITIEYFWNVWTISAWKTKTLYCSQSDIEILWFVCMNIPYEQFYIPCPTISSSSYNRLNGTWVYRLYHRKSYCSFLRVCLVFFFVRSSIRLYVFRLYFCIFVRRPFSRILLGNVRFECHAMICKQSVQFDHSDFLLFANFIFSFILY